MRQDNAKEVVDFLSKQLSIPARKITESKSLFHDLGVDGDDAVNLMLAYSSLFKVDITHFEIDEFFGPEVGTNPFAFMKEILFRTSYKKKKKLKVSDLISGAESGRLFS